MSEAIPGLIDSREGLALVRRMIHEEVARMRAAGIPVGEDEYRGLYIPDAEADRIMGPGSMGLETVEAELPSPELESLRGEFRQWLEGSTGRAGRLATVAGLSPFEVGVLLLCLLSESDLASERLIAYVQDDVSKRRPRVELAVRLFTPAGEREAARTAFDASSPLRKLRLIALHEEPGQPSTPLLARFIALDPRIAGYLLGRDEVDENLQPFTRLHPMMAAIPLPGELDERLGELASLQPSGAAPRAVAVSCPDASRLVGVAARLASLCGRPLLEVELGPAVAAFGVEPATSLAIREASLQEAGLLLAGVHELSTQEREALLRAMAGVSSAVLVVLGSAGPIAWPGVIIEVPGLDFDDRRNLWTAQLGSEHGIATPEIDALAGKFRLATREIEEAVALARGRALWREPRRPHLEADDLYAAARARSTPILNTLARKITPHYAWADIVLPVDTIQQLREICAHVEHRHLVYETWGFERKLALGKGAIALFAGQSGTGKTMAADIMAGALGLDLYKIDLSAVVSKYIGETEKNLASIFSEAESSNAILFFDEADALFGKRSEVKDAHDRYANIETAYLLQRMEEYAGTVILATNLKMNLDEAFMRRLHFVIDFPNPEEGERLLIWKGTVPAELPCAGDIDFTFLSRQFRITGGNIRNIVLAAAFMAASDGEAMGMAHLIRATRREYQKLGKMVTEAEFGQYVGLLRN
ncbi:MAG: ATP-binding protein [Dehalococcoidia bacterium]|nr:ATP-binding protein [Dehalococcoidia bacterium]